MSTSTSTEESHHIAVGIQAPQLQDLLRDDPLTRILDVRTSSEFESMHIPGSFNVPLDMLSEHVGNVAALDHPVVLVCHSGARAATAKEHLHAAGKTNLRVLDGGISAWQHNGGDLVIGAEKWALDRQVRGVAGTLVLAGMVASTAVSPAKWLAAAVGGGLVYSAVSGSCTMGTVLSKLPYNRGPACDLDRVLTAMGSEAA